MKPKVIIESHIPGVPDALSQQCDVLRLAPEEITADSVRDADALVVRTRTRCDASLLEGSRVRLVATATIGTDHIDIPWCRDNGIRVVSAPGCNAPAVAQYVAAALLEIFPDGQLGGKTAGIVGVGNVGKDVAEVLRRLGCRLLLCDPPRAEREGDDGFVALDTIAAESDVVTLHVPLTRDGRYPTYHMADGRFFDALRRRPVFINAARGAVADTPALLRAIDRRSISHAVIDCWEGEPDIDLNLLQSTTFATPHIAGYSLQGKLRATRAVVDALGETFGFDAPAIDFPANPALAPTGADADTLASAITDSYDILTDTSLLRSRPKDFEQLRNHYALRNEPFPFF